MRWVWRKGGDFFVPKRKQVFQLFSHYDKKCSVFHQTYMAFGLKFWERSDQNFNPNALWHEIDNAKHYQLSNTLPASSLFEFLESTETILTVKSLYREIS